MKNVAKNVVFSCFVLFTIAWEDGQSKKKKGKHEEQSLDGHRALFATLDRSSHVDRRLVKSKVRDVARCIFLYLCPP